MKRGLIRILISIALFLFVSGMQNFLFSQEPAFQHYTIDEGLPSNEVYDTYEDSLGYIWFATDHGISKYDGYVFQNFSTSDGLTHNTVFGFHRDHHGRMWMRMFNSSLCYLQDGVFKPYALNAQLKEFLGSNFIQQFAFDKAGNLWFVCINSKLGLFRQDAVSGKVERIKMQSGFNAFIRELDSGELISGMDLNDDSGLTGTEDTIAFTDNTWLFRIPGFSTNKSRRVGQCLRKSKSSFVFSFDNHVVQIENGKISGRFEMPEIINGSMLETDGSFWLCQNGFSRFSETKIASAELMQGIIATSILKDRTGNYWFTTLNKGVYFSPDIRIQTLSKTINQQEACQTLEFLNDQLYTIGKSGELLELDFNAETGIDTEHSKKWDRTFPNVNTIYAVPQKDLLILPNLLYKREENNRISIQPTDWTSSNRGYASTGDSILVANNTNWFISTVNGKNMYRSSDHGFSAFCTAIGIGSDRRIWIGTTDGLYFFDGEKTIPYQEKDSLFRQRITDIAFGKNDEIIVSTRGGGLIVIDGNRHYNIREKDGLCSDQCGTICMDDDVIWLCSNNGISRIQMSRKNSGLIFRTERINTQHGLPSNMINDVERKGDFIFLATGKGLTWFNVKQFELNTNPPPVYIQSFLINNREADPSKQELYWKDNNIAISFTGLLFRGNGQVHYRYRLEGYETEWNYTSDRVARYFNLPPGSYRFAVSAMNENGFWNEHPAAIQFVIPAHFTQTTWFRILLFILIAGIIYAIVFLYFRQQRNKARLNLALALAEQKALRAQMKPHFIFNSLNSIQHFILDHDSESAHLYLSRFSDLMRKILDNTRQNTISLSRETETLRLYLDLEKLRFGENFNYTIEISPDIFSDNLKLPPMLIQPYVENAIWHGLLLLENRPPRLKIIFSLQKDSLVCVIEDNGIGRKKAGEKKQSRAHESTGMKNIEERIALLNRGLRIPIRIEILDLYDETGEAAGTRITLIIPNDL